MCSRGSANIVEEGASDSYLIVLHVRVGSGLFSRLAKNLCHLFWRASSDSLRVAAQASRYSARLSVIVRPRAFRFLIASGSSGADQGLVYRPALDFPTGSFSAARRAELKRLNLSRSEIGAVENSFIASSMAAVNEFQSILRGFQRALGVGRPSRRYFAPDGGRNRGRGRHGGTAVVTLSVVVVGGGGIVEVIVLGSRDHESFQPHLLRKDGFSRNVKTKSCLSMAR